MIFKTLQHVRKRSLHSLKLPKLFDLRVSESKIVSQRDIIK